MHCSGSCHQLYRTGSYQDKIDVLHIYYWFHMWRYRCIWGRYPCLHFCCSNCRGSIDCRANLEGKCGGTYWC